MSQIADSACPFFALTTIKKRRIESAIRDDSCHTSSGLDRPAKGKATTDQPKGFFNPPPPPLSDFINHCPLEVHML